MNDPFKNFSCSACKWYASGKCFHLEHIMDVNPHDLCPEFESIMEDT